MKPVPPSSKMKNETEEFWFKIVFVNFSTRLKSNKC